MTHPPIHIHPRVQAVAQQMVAHRRHFHQHPELSFAEHETAAYILAQIDAYGLDIRHPVAKTGIVATMTNGAGPCLALRADMDALPVQETGGLPFQSQNEGVMHACGHDAHMAILLGVIEVLHALRERWSGTLKFLFQPAEEGPAGARHMIAEGALDDPTPDAIFGLHMWNYQQFGTIGVKSGPLMAAADIFDITVKGRGGHGAVPQTTIDPVYVAAQLITNIQSIISRNMDPLAAGVVTIGRIQGGTAPNIIAGEVTLSGTARSLHTADRQIITQRLEEICAGLAQAYSTEIRLDYQRGYPATVNDPGATAWVQRAAEAVIPDGVIVPATSMGGEDMAFYLQQIPGCYFFVGSAPADYPLGDVPHHCSHFNIDERALEVGASVFTNLILQRMGTDRT